MEGSSISAAASLRTLGLDATASAEDVRRAYRSLVRLNHPDLNPAAAPGALDAVVAAYRRLGRLGLLATEPVAVKHVDVYA
jgi:curved DNA-binding protein CbpA